MHFHFHHSDRLLYFIEASKILRQNPIRYEEHGARCAHWPVRVLEHLVASFEGRRKVGNSRRFYFLQSNGEFSFDFVRCAEEFVLVARMYESRFIIVADDCEVIL